MAMLGENSEISRLEQANTLGLAYLRTMVTLNGGAILALLTFIGNAQAQTAFFVPLHTLRLSLACFLVALVSLLVALVVSYSFTATAPESRYSIFWNRWIVALNSILALMSLVTFALGVLFLLLGTSSK
jgi:hypothetical protein